MINKNRNLFTVVIAMLICCFTLQAKPAEKIQFDFCEKISGVTVVGVVTIYDSDGDGKYDSWRIKGTFSSFLKDGSFNFGGKLKKVVTGSSLGTGLGIGIDNSLNVNCKFDSLKSMVEQVSFDVNVSDSTGKQIGKIICNEEFNNEETAYYISMNENCSKKIESNLNDDNQLVIKSVAKDYIDFEVRTLSDITYVVNLYDVNGKNVKTFYCSSQQGNVECRFDKLQRGCYILSVNDNLGNLKFKKIIL